jgi:hypothetical protein
LGVARGYNRGRLASGANAREGLPLRPSPLLGALLLPPLLLLQGPLPLVGAAALEVFGSPEVFIPSKAFVPSEVAASSQVRGRLAPVVAAAAALLPLVLGALPRVGLGAWLPPPLARALLFTPAWPTKQVAEGAQTVTAAAACALAASAATASAVTRARMVCVSLLQRGGSPNLTM